MVLGKKTQVVRRRVISMLDFGASCRRRGAHRLAIRMDQRAHAERIRFAACGSQLLIVEGANTAVADALRSENLDQVSALSLAFAYDLAKLIGRQLRIDERFERRQNARTGQPAA